MCCRVGLQVHRFWRVAVVAAMAAAAVAPLAAAGGPVPEGPPPPLTASPSSFVFPPTQVGQLSPPQQLTVRNTGSSTIQLTIYGWPQLPLRATGCDQPVAPGQSCIAQLVFAPIVGGPRVITEGRVVITAGQFGIQLPLTLQWLPLVADPEPPVSLGQVLDGLTSAPRTVTLRNYWTSNTTISSVSFPQGSRFAITSTTCSGPLVSGRCTVTVTYSPGTHVGADSSTLTVSGPWGVNNALTSEQFELTAEGVAAPIVSVSPASLSFLTPQQVGTSSPPQTVTVRNTGTKMLNLVAQTSGPGSGDFQASGCAGGRLAVGDSCTISVAFAPLFPSVYPRTETRLFLYDLEIRDINVTVPLTTGRVLPLDFDPRAVTFPNTRVGEASAPVTIRARNYNVVATPVTGYRMSNFEDFAVNSFTCSPRMASGAYCDIVVVFQPTKTGGINSEVIIFGPFYGQPAQETIKLTGTGVSQASSRPPSGP